MSGPTMIVVSIVLGVVAHLLFFVVVPKLAADRGVPARHFERDLTYTATCTGTEEAQRAAAESRPMCLQAYAKFKEQEARSYAFPVLFPYDLVMMTCLAGFLALAALTAGRYVPWSAGHTYLLILLPLLYWLADFAEDAVLAWLLTHADAVSAGRVQLLKSLTVAKFFTLASSYLVVAVLTVLALYGRIRGA